LQTNGTQQQLQSPSSGASVIAAAAVVSVAAASSSGNTTDCSDNCSSHNGIEQFNIAATTATSASAATMPAMAKEKASAAVSLGEPNFRDINMKDLAVVVGAMATTAAAATRLHHQQQHKCGCGAVSAVSATENNNNSRYGSSKYLTNGESPNSCRIRVTQPFLIA